MADVELFGIQAAVARHGDAPQLGELVAGVWRDRPVIALFAHDDDGPHYIILNGEDGRFDFTDHTGLTAVQAVQGELIIEPADGVVPYALPFAEPEGSALVITQSGDIGLRVTLPNPSSPGRPWIIMNSVRTGEPIPTGPRVLLRGFHLLLKIEGREKAIPIGSY